MPENQNIEYKESWRDEYLKWVCGFANAQGGTIYIGIRDDGRRIWVSPTKNCSIIWICLRMENLSEPQFCFSARSPDVSSPAAM